MTLAWASTKAASISFSDTCNDVKMFGKVTILIVRDGCGIFSLNFWCSFASVFVSCTSFHIVFYGFPLLLREPIKDL